MSSSQERLTQAQLIQVLGQASKKEARAFVSLGAISPFDITSIVTGWE